MRKIVAIWALLSSKMDSGVTYLEMIDVDVEASATVFCQRVREFLVGFAQYAMLRVFQRLSIFVSLAAPDS